MTPERLRERRRKRKAEADARVKQRELDRIETIELLRRCGPDWIEFAISWGVVSASDFAKEAQ